MVRIDRDLALSKSTDRARWSDPNSLEPAWDARAELAARFVSAGTRVLDLGCGRMALQQFLPWGCEYQGCDLVARDERGRLSRRSPKGRGGPCSASYGSASPTLRPAA
jgi:hypothetical protein